MENTITNRISRAFALRNIATDIFVFAGIYLIPTLSHILPFPLYILEPMRLFMLIGYLLSRNNLNGYFLAITIPLFSFFASGHPVFYKAILISLELFINLMFFTKLVKATKLNVAMAMFTSILASKLFYYILKFLFISIGLIGGSLFGIDIWIQLATISLITLLFYLLSFKLTRNSFQ